MFSSGLINLITLAQHREDHDSFTCWRGLGDSRSRMIISQKPSVVQVQVDVTPALLPVRPGPE